jgi:hypothetical protein
MLEKEFYTGTEETASAIAEVLDFLSIGYEIYTIDGEYHIKVTK